MKKQKAQEIRKAVLTHKESADLSYQTPFDY